MPAKEKVEKVKGLAEQLTQAQAAILADYRGLTVPEIRELRSALREAGTRFAVVKNRLTKLAVREAGMDALEEFLTGPTAIAFVMGDPVAGAKALMDAARRFPVIEVKGGFAEGRVLGADDVRTLAALQSREAMLATVAGLLNMELVKTASVLQALLRRFGAILAAYRSKLEETEQPDSEPPEEPAAEPATEESEPEPDTGEPEPEPSSDSPDEGVEEADRSKDEAQTGPDDDVEATEGGS